jgi:molecular chaperone Hsp33
VAKDQLQRFIFENADVRGALVQLDASCLEMIRHQSYAPAQQTCLCEFAAAAVLLVGHLKFEGLLALQARGVAGMDLILAECNEKLEFRGVVNPGDGRQVDQGILALTLTPGRGQSYQGIVPLDSGGLAACLAEYFQQSEQLPTWFYIASGEKQVAAMMLQALPAQVSLDAEESAENWDRLVHLAATLTEQELLSLPAEEVLYRLYHEESVRLFDVQPVRYACSCSSVRMERGLLTLGVDELQQMVEELPEVVTHCHFCGKQYVFSRMEMMQLLQGAGPQNGH